jgi:hypothetical protein
MKHIIYIFTFLILISCNQSNSETSISIGSDTISTKKDLKDEQRSSQYPKGENNVKDENSYRNEDQREGLEEPLSGFEKATLYKLTDTINADFDGDGIIDKAFYKKDNLTSGIIIINGQTNEEFRIGFNKPFAHFKEFNWVDYWGLVEDRETSETTFSEDGDVLGSKIVNLQNPSIALGADEIGGGLITFINGEYVWIHQTC